MNGILCGSERGAFVVAHRGTSDAAPENTLPAFEKALADGCRVLECDVQSSRDGEVVVLHDPRLDRTTDMTGAVSGLPWHSIARADAGYRRRFGDRFAGTRVPTLRQVLELARGRAEVMVEVKEEAAGSRANGLEERTVRAARDAGLIDAVAVISMSAAVIRRVRSVSPATVTGLVIRPRRRLAPEAAVACGADWVIAASASLLARPEAIARARRLGLRVGAYVVTSGAQARRLLLAGVESLACDDPAAIAATTMRGAA